MSEIPKAPVPEGPALKGPILKSRKKAELQDIADALGLDSSGKNESLATRIHDALDANKKAWAEIPRFSGLYTFKSAPKSKNPKTSADKAAEDISEKAKKLKAATGYISLHIL
jgi:hypothetical protein